MRSSAQQGVRDVVVAVAAVEAAVEVVVEVVVDVEVVEVNMCMNRFFPNRITFQWHISEKCNYRCLHCYQDSYSGSADISELYKCLDQFVEFVTAAKKTNPQFKAHINFTGGEPFLYKDFFQLLTKTKCTRLFSFGILSNGYLPDEASLKLLKELHPRNVQISLEGDKKTNDQIRGEGSYQDIIRALTVYSNYKIPVMISFTANSENYRQFPAAIKTARKYGAFKIWTDRYIPSGPEDPLRLSPDQTKEYFDIILKEQKKNKSPDFLITSDRALQFLVTGGKPYACSAGNTLLAILPNGDVLPCRRLPVKVGNMYDDNLIDLYNNSDLLIKLRDTSIDDCSDCYYKNSCKGGLKCLSYAVQNTPFVKDPDCRI